LDDYAKESRLKLELPFKRARLMLESHKQKQKTRKNAIFESDTRYSAKGTKGKLRYASSKA